MYLIPINWDLRNDGDDDDDVMPLWTLTSARYGSLIEIIKGNKVKLMCN